MPAKGVAGVRRSRVVATAVLAVLLLLSALLPHVWIADQGTGRWLFPTGSFFAAVQPAYLPATSLEALAFAINVTYLGLGMQELSMVAIALTFWIFASEDINRWLYRILLVAGWMLTLSVPLVITGWGLMLRAGTPAILGYAWVPTLLAGLAIVIGCRLSHDHIDGTWFLTKPELQ